MAQWYGAFRAAKKVGVFAVSTVQDADDPAELAEWADALIAKGAVQQGDWTLLSLEGPPAPLPAPPLPTRPRWRVKSARNLRAGPETVTALVAVLPVGAEGEELERQGDWWRMVFGPDIGWLYMGPGYGNTLEPVSN